MTDPTLAGELAQLDREYAILGELGRGGSAVVYRARDRALGREVAIKVVHPRPLAPDDDAVARLDREARTVAQLQHPNIVTVFAVRRLGGGGLALVMQLVPGRTLKAMVLQDGPVSPDRCQRILRDVAEALAYAHARGIVHRDVKPENIFIDEHSGRALLSDFGIARSADQESNTLTGTAIGTPSYMSPEQIDNAAIDGRSDLYSLGLVAWEMLTGRRPWDGESLYNVIYKQKNEELPPIEALRPGVPQRLQYVIERMLQKTPAARWAGADGLLAQLSHTVLPRDYGRWQADLRRRVERYRAEEKERARTAAERPAAEALGLLASTIRFVSGAGRSGAARDAAASSSDSPSLGDTTSIPAGGSLEPLPAAVPAVGDRADDARGGSRVSRPPARTTRRTPRSVAAASWERGSALGVRPWMIAAVLVAAAGALAAANADRIERWLAPPSTDGEALGAEALNGGASPSTAAGAVSDGGTAMAPGPTAAGPAPAGTGSTSSPLLALGARHSCAITPDGAAQCWGANERGQLGDGTDRRQATPVRVEAQLTFAGVSAGANHSCAVTRTGDVYCWGDDTAGKLGDATTVRRSAPVRVAGPGVYRGVSAGTAHSCAVTIEGVVHCWGGNARGQLGEGTKSSHAVPTSVTGVTQPFVQVVAGTLHSCGLSAAGTAFCWGSNARGELGVGAGTERLVPTAVSGTTRFTMLAAGSDFTCGLATDGAAWCWGANGRGQLGTGNRTASRTPVRVRLPGAASALAAGGQHGCAIVPARGETYCWGSNTSGELGTGTRNDAAVPARVTLDMPLTTIAAGVAHTCGMTASGALRCWGGNGEGQLGDSTQLARPTPIAVLLAPASSLTTPTTPTTATAVRR